MMKKGVVFRVSLFRFALFLFTLLFFVSAFASTPARIKRLTLKCTEIVSLDCSQELALHQTGGIGLSTARTAIRLVPETHCFPAARDVVSGNIYRGPPPQSL